jgi:hypothetical protein
MGLFSRNKTATLATSEPEVQAAVGWSNTGATQIGDFYAYQDGTRRARAMSLPVITRSRDLICGTISNLRLEMYREMWNGDDMEAVSLAPRSWLDRIDKSVPNNFILAWTVDDLLFTGSAYWYVTSRSGDGYPASFTRLPSAMITLQDQQTGVRFGPSNQILFNGLPLESSDVIQFMSPIEGLNYTSTRAIETAIKIEEARFRNAASAIPAGVLQQVVGSEPLSADELASLAAAFNLARMTNQTAALNPYITYTETSATPDKMLLIDSADYSAKDLSRATSVPPYLVGVSTGSYAYTNATQSRIDLWTFGCLPFAKCIEETLSSDNVLPHGTKVKFDVDDFLGEMNGDRPEGDSMDIEIPQDATRTA